MQEALAEIVSVEYLDNKYDSYDFCVMNVSMLMDTIGPKIVWETVFSGDDTNLINILKNNLNENEYDELISYLTSSPQETVKSCQRINSIIANGAKKEALNACADIFDQLTGVLGLVYNRKNEALDSEIEALIEKRTQARKDKDFKTADEIRDKLKEMGIILEDTPQGVKWSRS